MVLFVILYLSLTKNYLQIYTEEKKVKLEDIIANRLELIVNVKPEFRCRSIQYI